MQNCKNEAGVAKDVTVMVGGWDPSADPTTHPPSFLPLTPGLRCGLRLPRVPALAWDPVMELVAGQLILCFIDYNEYRVQERVHQHCYRLQSGPPRL